MKTISHAMLMFVLACSVFAMAQTGMSSDSSMKKSDQMGKATTMTGCLVQKDGKYLLTTKKHPAGIQLMGPENELKPHVGHELSVTGTIEKSGGAMKSDDRMSGNAMAMSMAGFHVSSVKMISDKCAMDNMSNMSSGMSH